MRPVALLVVAAAALAAAAPCLAQEAPDSRPAANPATTRAARPEPAWRTWDVGGVKREALVYRPAGGEGRPAPVVLAFHGHGGSARQAARSFRLHQHWPAAFVLYLEGLPTPIPRFDPEGRQRGWQIRAGHQGDRDLAFVDAVLASLAPEERIDTARVYATGHSNGGTFTYLLWARRAERFAAFAPSAAGSWSVLSLEPKPAMHLAGRNDQLVPFANQRRTMAVVRARNGCDGEPRPWAQGCLLHPSSKGAPFVSFIHEGGHRYPSEASELVVRFFAEHALPAPESRPEGPK